ncbi:MAG: dockerin type I repeat-containing protein [Ruminococcus sp.]|nr:dockerin type I repeat-containing protein [Ruminococcus sp.]
MTTATVKILPCPYESYTLLSAPSRVYVHRDSETGYIYDGDYILQPEDLTGLSFELGYSNGTTEIIDADNIDMESMKINGYPYSIGEYMVTGAGNIPVTLSYKGMDIKYSVQVVETPVESIEVIKAPDKTEYEDRYHADYSGMKIKVNYKDGTFDTVTLNKENMEYVLNGSLYCYVPVGDNKLCLSRQFDVVAEDYYTTVSCLGCLTEYNEIKYTKSREVASIIRVEDFAYNTDGMTVYVEYESGQEENLTYSMLDYYDYGDDMYEGFAMTENGVAYFDTALKSKDDYSSVYSLYTLDKYIDIEVMDIKPGDVNGDNNITVDDVTLVQLHLAKLVILQNNYLAVADTDKDGLITIMDATMIQYYISQFITEL